MLGPSWVSPLQFTHVILWRERSPELRREFRSFNESCAGWSLTSSLLPAALEHQGPCWEISVLSTHLRRSRQGEQRVCACFPTASPMRDVREKCTCQSQLSLSRTTRMAPFCRHTGHVPYPPARHWWTLYAKIHHHHLLVSIRTEASAGTANTTQLQADR